MRVALALVLLLALPATPAAAAEPTAPPGAFVSLADVDPTIVVEMRYLTPHNFIGRRIPGYRENVCLLTRPAAEALKRVQAAVRAQGATLKVYDCYRPQRSVDAFVKWAKDLSDRRMKAEFYPRVRKQVLFKEGYIASQSGHSRGSTVDLTLVKSRRAPRSATAAATACATARSRPAGASATTRSTWERAMTASTRSPTRTTGASAARCARTGSACASR